MVERIRSGLTQAASTGPSHSRMAGMVRPLDFWLWVGPRAITAWSGWAATRRPLTRPRVTRQGVGARTYSSLNTCGRAQPVGPTWSPEGAARSTTMARPMRRRVERSSDDR